MKKFFAPALAAAAFFSPGAATPQGQQGAQPPPAAPRWETYTYPGEEFSVSLPELPLVHDTSRMVKNRPNENGKARAFAAYADGVVYLIWSFDRPQAGEDVDHFAQYFRTYKLSREVKVYGRNEVRLGDFAGKRCVVVDGRFPDGENEFAFYVYRARSHAYVVAAYGAGERDAAVRRFFESFTLSDKPTGTRVAAAPPPKPEGRKQKPEKAGPDTRRDGADADQPAPATPKTDGPVDYTPPLTAREVTRKAIPVFRPEPPYTEVARKNQITGTVTLRMVMNWNGAITNVVAIDQLPHGLTEMAISAARQIKFIPAIKDGRRVSMWATVQYNFNIY